MRPRLRSFSGRFLAASTTVIIVVSSPSLHAASAAWNVDTAGSWATAGNWTPAAAPGSTTIESADIATFSKALTADRVVTVDLARYIGGISFGNTSAFRYSFSAGNLNLKSGGVIQTLATNGSHVESFATPIQILGTNAGTASFTAGATSPNSTLIFSGVKGSATTGNTTILTLNGTNTGANAITGAVTDGGTGKLAITKADAGSWGLSGVNTYTGVTTVTGGMLSVAKTISLYSNSSTNWTAANLIVGSGGTLAFNVGGVGEFATGDVTTLLGNLTTSINNNGLKAGSTIGFNTNTAAGGTFTIADNIADSTGTGAGSVGVTKLGTNTLVLTGTNTYTGVTTISGGTLQFSSTASLYNGAPGSWTTAKLAVASGGTALFNVGGIGEFTTGDVTTLLGNLTTGINNNGLQGGSLIGFDTTNSGGSFAITDNIVNSTGIGSGSLGLIKAGAGTLTLSGTNTYTGITTVNGGIVALSNGAAIGDGSAVTLANIAGVGLLLNASETIGLLAGGGTTGGNVDLQANTLTLGNSTTATFAGSLSGAAGGLTKTAGGILTLSGTNTYTGVTTISGGTIQFAKTASLYNSNLASWTASNIIVGSGGMLSLNVGGAGEFTSSDVTTLLGNLTTSITNNGLKAGSSIGFDTTGASLNISDAITDSTGTGAGSVGVSKFGTNTLSFTGTNTYTGITNVYNGILTVAGDESAATGGWNIAPLNGENILTRTVNFNAGSKIAIATGKVFQLGYTTATGQGATLNVLGTVTNGGVLNIQRSATLNVNSGGAWTQSGGMLIAANASGSGPTMTVASGGSFTYNNAAPSLITINATNNNGTSTLNIAGTFTTNQGFTETVTGTGAATINLNGGTLKLTADIPVLTATAGSTFNFNLGTGGGTIDTQAFSATMSRPIGGSTALTKLGSGTLTLSGTNTNTGGVTVTAGALGITNNASLGTGTKTIVMTNGTAGNPNLRLDGTAGAISLPSTFTYTVSNDTVDGVLVNIAGNNTVAGQFNITSGGGGMKVTSSGGDLNITANITATSTSRSVSLAGTSTGKISGNISDGSTVGLPISKSGSGTWTLAGTNTYTGTTTLTAGTLALGSTAALGTTGSINFGGGTLQHSATNTTDYSARFSNAASRAYKVDTNGQPVTWASALTSTGGTLTKSGAGTLTLTGANTYTGATGVAGGILSISSAYLNDAANVSIASGGAKLDLNFVGTDLVGSLTLDGTPVAVDGSTYGATGSGATHIDNDHFSGSGKVQVGAITDPFPAWIATFPSLTGGDTAKSADPDHDGRSNLLEFALHGDPTSSANDGKMRTVISTVGLDTTLTLTLPVRAGVMFIGAGDLVGTVDSVTYKIQGSTALTDFVTSNISEVTPVLSADMPIITGSGWEYRTFRLPGTVTSDSRGFLRVLVTDTP